MPAEQLLLESTSSAPTTAPPNGAPVTGASVVDGQPSAWSQAMEKRLIREGLAGEAFLSPDASANPEKAARDAVFDRAYVDYIEEVRADKGLKLEDVTAQDYKDAEAFANAALARYDGGSSIDEALEEARAVDEEPTEKGTPISVAGPRKMPKVSEPGSIVVTGTVKGRPEDTTFADWVGVRPSKGAPATEDQIGEFAIPPLFPGATPLRLAVAGPERHLGVRLSDMAGQPSEYGAHVEVMDRASAGPRTRAVEEVVRSTVENAVTSPVHVRSDVDAAPVRADADTYAADAAADDQAQTLVPVNDVYPADATTTMHLPAHVLDGVSPVVFEPAVYRSSGRPPKSPVFADMFLDGAEAEYARGSRLEVIEAARRARRTRRLQRVGIMFSNARASFGRTLRHLVRADRIRRADGTFSVRPELVAHPVVFNGVRRGSTYQSRGAGSRHIIV